MQATISTDDITTTKETDMNHTKRPCAAQSC